MTGHPKDEETRAAEQALSWYGWGSPVGLGLFLVALGVFLVMIGGLLLLLRLAIFGL